MKTKLILVCLSVFHLLAACRTMAPIPSTRSVTETVKSEFSLAPGQSAAVAGTDLTFTFHSVLSDERCPVEVECVASGPATVSLSVQQGNGTPTDFTLQTFTDQNGRSPNVQFEGVTNRAEVGNYLIRIVSVTPYPRDLSTKIESSEYRLVLSVSSN